MMMEELWDFIEQAKGNPLLEIYENLTDDKQLQALILLDKEYPNESILQTLQDGLVEKYPSQKQLDEWKQEDTDVREEYQQMTALWG